VSYFLISDGNDLRFRMLGQLDHLFLLRVVCDENNVAHQ